MSEPIVYVDTSEIVEGKLEDLKPAMKQLAEFVETNEPQLISYGFFLNERATRMTVVAVHPDSDSLEFHMEIGGPEFRKFTDFLRLESIDVYGEITDAVLKRLQQKSEMLGTGTVVVHDLYAGFDRSGTQAESLER